MGAFSLLLQRRCHFLEGGAIAVDEHEMVVIAFDLHLVLAEFTAEIGKDLQRLFVLARCLEGKGCGKTAAELGKEAHQAHGHRLRAHRHHAVCLQELLEFLGNGGHLAQLGGNGGGSLGELIKALEEKNCNVIAVSGLWPGKEIMTGINPDLIIYQPHGRLGDEAIEFLKEKNIPLFCPIKVNQNYEEYLKDQRGMTGGMLSQSITMPELDGGTTPFVLSALYRNERGLLEFRMIPDRLERFVELVRKTTDLKRKNNADKKIALIYYGSIGKESATAGLGTSQTILNILRRLQKEGYNTGVLPESVEALDKEIKENNERN